MRGNSPLHLEFDLPLDFIPPNVRVVNFTLGGGIYPDQPVISDSYSCDWGGLAAVNAALGGSGMLHVVADGAFACLFPPCTGNLAIGGAFVAFCPATLS